MGGSFKIGRAFGIDVKVHWTFLLLIVFFGLLAYQATGSAGRALAVIGLILGLFVCVLLHEYGHSLTAQRLGIEINDITLLPIGGLARMKSLPERPADEVKIAIAGPLVNVVLAPVFFGVGYLLGSSPFGATGFVSAADSAGQFFSFLGVVNVLLAVFNLIPAFPMDGGRVLRGLLASRVGPVRATDISSAVGQGFALLFFIYGLLGGNLLLVLIAVFIFFGAGGEAELVRQRELMRGLTVRDVMGTRRRTETVTPWHTFGQVLDSVIHGYQTDFPVVDEDGRLVGMLTRNEIMSAAHSPDRFSEVRQIMRTEFPTISPEADLFAEGQKLLQESGLRAIPVVEDGELVGMLTVEDMSQAALLRDIRKLQQRPAPWGR
ncbi:peptidase M50 [Rubrobacter xylanophilus DSM 9941]|uniref:Zinc metalloprotease n=1 Tax=Rubrobacter xylanophilus (strain DSM 9941 / JCM 11954 / NBRC 16129 / PRD-1) TaxID=266117 RepID=Q1ARA7_RUBXD|nr:site-2 protease family protein [Rubrobacter xylanophilus]ABG06071.1 peptidase M50 [Rubrobacter xylanophilus DSM 9941]